MDALLRMLLCISCVMFLASLCDARDHARLPKMAQQNEAKSGCLYKNEMYPAGKRFRPDSCTFCHCPRTGGRPRCAIEDCRYELDCIRYEKTTQSLCCDLCVEHGCRDGDGTLYKPEELVSVTSCTECRCPIGGGRIECGHVTCPRVACVDSMTSLGACCPVCPNGPNCWLGKEILPADKVITRNRCKTCRCPTEELPDWLARKGARAVCSITC